MRRFIHRLLVEVMSFKCLHMSTRMKVFSCKQNPQVLAFKFLSYLFILVDIAFTAAVCDASQWY